MIDELVSKLRERCDHVVDVILKERVDEVVSELFGVSPESSWSECDLTHDLTYTTGLRVRVRQHERIASMMTELFIERFAPMMHKERLAMIGDLEYAKQVFGLRNLHEHVYLQVSSVASRDVKSFIDVLDTHAPRCLIDLYEGRASFDESDDEDATADEGSQVESHDLIAWYKR